MGDGRRLVASRRMDKSRPGSRHSPGSPHSGLEASFDEGEVEDLIMWTDRLAGDDPGVDDLL